MTWVHLRIKCTRAPLSRLKEFQAHAASKRARKKSIFKRTRDVERMLRKLRQEGALPSCRPRAWFSPRTIARRVVLIYGGRPADLRISNSRLRGSMVPPGEGYEGYDATKGWAPRLMCVHYARIYSVVGAGRTLRITFEGDEGVIIGPCRNFRVPFSRT